VFAQLTRRLLLLALCFGFAGPAVAQEPLLTVAERSDYKATSRYVEVMAFCDELAKRAPLIRQGQLGVSGEGRKLPLLILADPPVSSAEEAKKSGKLIVLIQGNIHAGEVDGKEALLMLARDLATAKEKPLLKDLVLVFCPIFNPDGNEKFDKKNRPEQNGPAEVGIRENADGLDLNRDFVKLETPEVRALVRFFNQWDPALFIDAHTTNGSKHRYTLTYEGPRNPNTPPGIVETVRDRMFPEAGKRLEKSGYKSFFYGNFTPDRKEWRTVPAQPRYGIHYVGLRNRLSVLSESYSYASFRDRVLASREFVHGCLEYTAAHKDEVKKLVSANDPPARVALRIKNVPLGAKSTVLGFEEKEKDGKRVTTDKPHDYSLEYLGKSEATLEVTRPYAYLFPPSYAKAIETLQRHGITVEELREDIDLNVTVYRADEVIRSPREFNKHNLMSVTATDRTEARRIPAGTILVRTGQKLGALATILLEPASEDGLTTWNFFDEGLADGKDFPVLRLPARTPLTAGPVRPLAEERKLNKPFTKDMLLGAGPPPNLGGNPVAGLTWLDDGEHFLQVKSGELRKVHARTGRSDRFVDSDLLTKSLSALPALGADTIQSLSDGPNYRMNARRTGILFEHGNDLYVAHFDGKPAVRLTKSAGPKEFATFSPDGKFVAFVRASNLFVVDVDTQTEKALTTDGGGAILNGKADWVYFEEIYNRRSVAFWWSPDSKHLAFLRFDDTPVHKFTVLNNIPTRQKVEITPYPKAGDPNPHVTLGVVPVGGGEVFFPDLSNYSADAMLVTRVGWTPDGKQVYFYVQNRIQTWLDFCTSSPREGPPKCLFRETTKAWVNDPGEPTYLKDGSFLLASERNGWKHFYHFDKDGKLIRQVTSGDWEARTLHRVDEKNGWLYLSGTKDSHIAPNLYRCKLDGSVIERLTAGNGSHQVSVSPACNLFIDSYTNFETPTRVYLHKADGKKARTLDNNPVYAREEYRFGKFEHVEIKLGDGFVLEGTLVKPPDFDTAKRYPVWFMTYAGPHTPTVRDSWDGGRVYDQVLAGMGFVVFHCDPRSASGKGACSTWTAYKQLGVQELKDIEGAMDWLCSHSWVDANRIGMSGSSYGGFMTAYALTHSKRFAAGIAGAPVTDWRNYDSIYTERYMSTPQENPDGYATTSVVKAAKNLHGRLLIQHGLMDDNVHPQNAIQLMDALQKADKDFEVMFYAQARHGGFGRHSQRQSLEFIQRLLDEKSSVPMKTMAEGQEERSAEEEGEPR
jgi:dipeptidyl aminopeptidase/acylaminoacyl peptidase